VPYSEVSASGRMADAQAARDHMIGHRQQRILAVLAEHPAGLAAENLLAALSSSSPPNERHKMLQAIHALEAGGRVSIAGKRRRGEIAGALVSSVVR
jgi:hypothetical protein